MLYWMYVFVLNMFYLVSCAFTIDLSYKNTISNISISDWT